MVAEVAVLGAVRAAGKMGVGKRVEALEAGMELVIREV
jgi:hypothetical protein